MHILYAFPGWDDILCLTIAHIDWMISRLVFAHRRLNCLTNYNYSSSLFFFMTDTQSSTMYWVVVAWLLTLKPLKLCAHVCMCVCVFVCLFPSLRNSDIHVFSEVASPFSQATWWCPIGLNVGFPTCSVPNSNILLFCYISHSVFIYVVCSLHPVVIDLLLLYITTILFPLIHYLIQSSAP